MIKYKGNTSKILSDISLEFWNIVDLKTSEIILKGFFEKVLKDNSLEKDIEVLSSLPAALKPFCQKNKEAKEIEHALFHEKKIQATFEKIFNVLQRYVNPDGLLVLYSCIPLKYFPQIKKEKKEIFLAA